MLPNGQYIANSNSVQSNYVIAMGNASENSENLRSLLNFTSFGNIFNWKRGRCISSNLKVVTSSNIIGCH